MQRIVLLALLIAGRLRAQPAPDPRAWNAPQALDLAARATTRRATQLADTSLRDYRATARGYLAFLGQLGDVELPRVIQATQVATEVYWKAPNVSKQRVVGERDTTVLPTDNSFYRDRFGIVQNNFPDVIRVGNGNDVADVPHPLSPTGVSAYDFAVRDSLQIRVGGSTLSVVEVQVRPKDASKPRFVGSLFVNRDDAQVVRMAFTFTSTAYIDKRNESVAIVLENALVQGRYWLPRHQEVEVRRSGTFLDFPAHGIIRGRWEIGDYAVNGDLPPQTFAGPPLEFLPPAARRAYPFVGRVLDSLPTDVRMVSDEDVRRVQAEAQALVRREVLARARGSAVSARTISDFARVNRVEGLALGAGYLLRLGNGVSVATRARYGVGDGAVKFRVAGQREWGNGTTARLSIYRDYREAGDEPEVSLARNTLAAQEFGSDYTDPYDSRGIALSLDVAPAWLGFRPSVELAAERQGALGVHASPFTGRYEPTIPASRLDALRLSLGAERPLTPGPFGTDVALRGQLRGELWSPAHDYLLCGSDTCGETVRLAAAARVERPFGDRRLVSQTTFSIVAGDRRPGSTLGGPPSLPPLVPAQDLVYRGGPVTGPGYAFHQFAGRFAASQRVELRTPIPFPSIPLGQFGRSPAAATLAPYAHTVYVAQPSAVRGPLARGWYPALGVGAYVFYDLLRVDVARGLRDGRWTFAFDVTRDFWRIL